MSGSQQHQNLSLRRRVKYRLVLPAQYLFASSLNYLRRSRGALRMLLATDFGSYTSDQQYAPFLRYADELASRLGVVSLQTDIDNARRILSVVPNHFDVVAVKLSFRTEPQDALRWMEILKELAPGARLVYFDGDDDVGVQWPEVLSRSDLYVKKQRFKNRVNYGAQNVGKSNLTDYAYRTHGVEFAEDIIPRNSPVPDDQWPKIAIGWNIALDDKIESLRERLNPSPLRDRPVDIVCRATVNEQSWLYHLRKSIAPSLRPLERRFKVLNPTARVSQETYYEEMLSSKICVSPFGYGEICWRDFEAILSGCLLVKPDMSHVETSPDIFVPYETYVPVSWDYSNLASECERYLDMPEECERVASRARQKLLSYYENNGFLDAVEGLLEQLGIDSGTLDDVGGGK